MATTVGGQADEARQALSAVPDGVEKLRAKPRFRRIAQAGLGARAVIYALLAWTTAEVAVTGRAKTQASGSGALAQVARQAGGRAVLSVMAVGLAGYALWRLSQLLGRDDRHGPVMSGFERAGWALVAMVYTGLAIKAVALAAGARAGSGGKGASSHPEPFVASVLRWPAGPAWVGLAGVVIGGAGAGLAAWGAVHNYADTMDASRAGRGQMRAARLTGIVGDITRGALVVVIAVYLLTAAVTDNPSHAKSMDAALQSFDRLAAGPVLLAVVALGLAAFSVYSVFEALYRKV